MPCSRAFEFETIKGIGPELCGLPRIPVPRRWVNKGKKRKGRGLAALALLKTTVLLFRHKRLTQLFGQRCEDKICRIVAGDFVRTGLTGHAVPNFEQVG